MSKPLVGSRVSRKIDHTISQRRLFTCYAKKVGDDFVVQAILLRVMYEPVAADYTYSDSMQGESVKTATAIPVNSDVSVFTRHFANGPKKPPPGSSS